MLAFGSWGRCSWETDATRPSTRTDRAQFRLFESRIAEKMRVR
jgi:hypothetical protein